MKKSHKHEAYYFDTLSYIALYLYFSNIHKDTYLHVRSQASAVEIVAGVGAEVLQ